ncbi:MAG: homoserine O-acetyltransferase [Candidatus Micrarchaeota archaeon]
MGKEGESVGIVKPNYFDFDELKLESGETLSKVRIAYETYGKLNRDKSNAVLIFHALSGDAHAAGKHRKTSKRAGWYDLAVGPKKTFDTRKYFVICANVISGCKGSSGPSSINPKTGEPYGLEFPIVSIHDMVKAHYKLIKHLGINKLFCVSGGSMGGMQALQWLVDYPDSAHCAVLMACSARQYPMGMVFHDIGRKVIMSDPDWRKGAYYSKCQPRKGLSLARQIGHITYLSQEVLERKFGRKLRKRSRGGKFGEEFEIQSYFNYKGKHFTKRFDANSYLYITHAIDNFDLTEGKEKPLADVFKHIKSKVLLFSFSSDWLYPPWQVEEIFAGLAEAGVSTQYKKLELPYGHDAFLVYNNTLGNILLDFLEKEEKSYGL